MSLICKDILKKSYTQEVSQFFDLCRVGGVLGRGRRARRMGTKKE
jgi:hypothetical protein